MAKKFQKTPVFLSVDCCSITHRVQYSLGYTKSPLVAVWRNNFASTETFLAVQERGKTVVIRYELTFFSKIERKTKFVKVFEVFWFLSLFCELQNVMKIKTLHQFYLNLLLHNSYLLYILMYVCKQSYFKIPKFLN